MDSKTCFKGMNPLFFFFKGTTGLIFIIFGWITEDNESYLVLLERKKWLIFVSLRQNLYFQFHLSFEILHNVCLPLMTCYSFFQPVNIILPSYCTVQYIVFLQFFFLLVVIRHLYTGAANHSLENILFLAKDFLEWRKP